MKLSEVSECKLAIENIINYFTTFSSFRALFASDYDEDETKLIVGAEQVGFAYDALGNDEDRELFKDVVANINGLYDHLYINEEKDEAYSSLGALVECQYHNEEELAQAISELYDNLAILSEKLPEKYKDDFQEFEEKIRNEIGTINEYLEKAKIDKVTDDKRSVDKKSEAIPMNILQEENEEDYLWAAAFQDQMMDSVVKEREAQAIFTAEDKRVLSDSGSKEYMDLKNAVERHVVGSDPSARAEFNASWEYLRRKNTVPWTPDGKKRVESAAKLMAASALQIIDGIYIDSDAQKSPEENLPKDFIERVHIEILRNATFRNTLISRIPQLIQNQPKNMMAAELYSVARLCEAVCRKEQKSILVKGKMDAENLETSEKYQNIKAKIAEFAIIPGILRQSFERKALGEKFTPEKLIEITNEKALNVEAMPKNQKNYAAQLQNDSDVVTSSRSRKL